LGIGIKQLKLGTPRLPNGSSLKSIYASCKTKKLKVKNAILRLISKILKIIMTDYHVNLYPSSKIAEAIFDDSIWATMEWK
jgi:hypothetical protein